MSQQLVWDNYFSKHSKSNPFVLNHGVDKHVVDFVGFYDFPVGSRVLDCGCAEGKNTLYFFENGFTVTGIDISPTVIERATKVLPAVGFHVKDIRQLEETNNYDVLVDAGALHVNNIEYWPDVVKRYKNALADKGKMFIRIFNDPKDTKEPIFSVVDGVPVYGMSRNNITKLMEKYFKISNIIFDPFYGEHGQGCYYYYLEA